MKGRYAGVSFDQPGREVFLGRVVREFPFPLIATQSDGGGEFLGAFGPAANELKLLHYLRLLSRHRIESMNR